MGYASGYAVGANAKNNEARLKQDRENSKETAKLKRLELSQTRDDMNLKLLQSGYSKDGSGNLNITAGGRADIDQQNYDLQAQQIELQGQALRSLQGRLASASTDEAIDEFIDIGDAEVFQRTLDKDEFLKKAWGERDVQLIANIDFENDGKLLESEGISKDYKTNPEIRADLKKSIWKYYDGSQWHVGHLSELVKETGVLNRVSTKRGDTIINQLGRYNSAIRGSNVELNESQLAVNQQNAETQQKKTNLAVERTEINREQDVAELDYRNRKLAYDKDINRGGTTIQKNMREAERQTGELLKEFGGEEKFFATDFSNGDNYNKAYSHISKLERFENVQLSESEKKELNSIRQLITLADPAKDLTEKDTGILDSFLGKISKYVVDDGSGVRAKSSYVAFRNTVRHALFGAALTKTEAESFNEAFGTLGQKLGPVLKQFKTSLTQVKSKMESMQRNGNPYIMHVRLGVDKKRLGNIMDALDERIKHISGLMKSKKGSKKDSHIYKPQKKKQTKKTLDEIFESSRGGS
jgi:hypothetical protein